MSEPDEDDIRWLEIGIRNYNFLTKAGITRISQLSAMSDMELLRERGIGRKYLKEIRQAILLHV